MLSPSSDQQQVSQGTQARIYNGMQVPSFLKSNWLLNSGLMKLNLLLSMCRALMSVRVVGGQNLVSYDIADGGVQWDFSKLAAVASSGGSPVFSFQPQTLHGDYYDAYQVIAGVVSSVTTFHILKPPKHRQSYTAEVIDGNNFTYAYSTDNERIATAIIAGSPTEDQVSVPRFVVAVTDAAALIYAVQLDASAQQTIGGVVCNWLEISPARVWCRKTGT